MTVCGITENRLETDQMKTFLSMRDLSWTGSLSNPKPHSRTTLGLLGVLFLCTVFSSNNEYPGTFSPYNYSLLFSQCFRYGSWSSIPRPLSIWISGVGITPSSTMSSSEGLHSILTTQIPSVYKVCQCDTDCRSVTSYKHVRYTQHTPSHPVQFMQHR